MQFFANFINMSAIQDTVASDKLELYLDATIFTRDGILKCCYWYTRSYLVDILTKENFFWLIIRPQVGQKLADPEALYAKLKKDLIDFQLRDTITKETRNIRDLLVAKAFANGALDEESSEDMSDPVGL